MFDVGENVRVLPVTHPGFNITNTISKAFATGGENLAYYLSESRAVARSGLGAAAAVGENWADSSPLYHHNGCSALAPLHAGCRKHGEAARNLFCGRQCQWA